MSNTQPNDIPLFPLLTAAYCRQLDGCFVLVGLSLFTAKMLQASPLTLSYTVGDHKHVTRTTDTVYLEPFHQLSPAAVESYDIYLTAAASESGFTELAVADQPAHKLPEFVAAHEGEEEKYILTPIKLKTIYEAVFTTKVQDGQLFKKTSTAGWTQVTIPVLQQEAKNAQEATKPIADFFVDLLVGADEDNKENKDSLGEGFFPTG